MAKKPIEYKQIAQPKLLSPLQKEAEELNKTLSTTEDIFKAIVKEANKIAQTTPLDSFKNVEKVEKSLNQVVESTKGLDKIEKERARLQERLKDLEDGRAKANFELKEQIRLQSKQLRDNAKASKESENAYKVLTRQTNEAQAEFKKLAAELGVNSKEAKKAKKEFDRLNDQLEEINKEAKDGRRDVGRYSIAVENLSKEMGGLADKADEATGGLASFAKNLTNPYALAAASVAAAGSAFTQTEEGADLLNNTIARSKGLFNTLTSAVGNTIKDIKNGGGIIDATANNFDNFTKNATDAGDALVEAQKSQKNLNAGLRVLNVELAKLGAEYEFLSGAAGDSTRSLEEQQVAALSAQTKAVEIASKEKAIIEERIRIIDLEIEARKGLYSPELQDQRAEFVAQEEEINGRLLNEIRGLEQEKNQITQDQAELRLDFLFDVSDREKTIREKDIEDERRSFEDRKKLLTDLRNSLTSTYQEINKELQAFAGEDFDLFALSSLSAKEQAEFLQNLESSEIITTRVKEGVVEYLQVIEDLDEAQKNLNENERESLEIKEDIELQQKALNDLAIEGANVEKILDRLSDERLESQIENLRKRIEASTKNSDEQIKLTQELNEKLLEQQSNRIKKQQDNERKNQEETQKLLEDGFDLFEDLLEKRGEKRLEAIDKEIEAEQRRVDALRTLAAEGNEDAENNIALSEKRAAELELKREQQIRRQERLELGFAAVQAYSAKVAAEDENPLASTITDINVLKAFVNSLPAFYEGTELVDSVSDPVMSGKDGHIIRVDGSERILTGMQNKMIGNMSNNELAELAHNHRNQQVNYDISPVIIEELRGIKKATIEKPSYLGMDYDKISDAVVRKIQKGNKMERIHKKNGGIWG